MEILNSKPQSKNNNIYKDFEDEYYQKNDLWTLLVIDNETIIFYENGCFEAKKIKWTHDTMDKNAKSHRNTYIIGTREIGGWRDMNIKKKRTTTLYVLILSMLILFCGCQYIKDSKNTKVISKI